MLKSRDRTKRINVGPSLEPLLGEGSLVSETNIFKFSSTERPYVVANWGLNANGCEFWEVVRRTWPSFDLIPHDEYEKLFHQHRRNWQITQVELELPDRIKVYRGQDAGAPLGLSWTIDRAVAEGFALGHRGRHNPDPIILTHLVDKPDVAMFLTEREESEVVLFNIPSSQIYRAADA